MASQPSNSVELLGPDGIMVFDLPPAEDSGADAAVRAVGIDPATNKWISPMYDTGEDPAQVAAQARAAFATSQAASQSFSAAQLAKAHQAAGGFTADLLNPLSSNVDPNAWNATAANSVNASVATLPWTTITVVVILLLIVVGIHEVKTF